MSIKSYSYNTEKFILVDQDNALTIGCIVSNSGAVTDDDGNLVIKAGTPVGSTENVLENRDTVLSAGSASPSGIVLHDVDDFDSDGNGNATLIVRGTIDLLKIDETTRALITDAVKTSLPLITFINGRE